jgi:hypothetical protein
MPNIILILAHILACQKTDKFCFTTPSKEVIGGEFSLKKKHFDMIFSNLFLVKEVLFIFFLIVA